MSDLSALKEPRLAPSADDRVTHGYPATREGPYILIRAGTLSYCGLDRLDCDWIGTDTPPANACDECERIEKGSPRE